MFENIFSLLTKCERKRLKMLRGLSALLLVAMMAVPVAGQQVPSDDEFALLGIPRPGAMLAGFGLPPVGGGFSKLLNELTQGDDGVTPNGAENAGGRVTIIGLPHMLSGLFRQSQEQARPTMTMRFRPMFAMPAGPSLSRPLKELSMLANGCEPCSRVQSHMRSMSIMLGPNGQRVETVTEVGGGTAQHRAYIQQSAASAAQPFPAALLLRAQDAPVGCFCSNPRWRPALQQPAEWRTARSSRLACALGRRQTLAGSEAKCFRLFGFLRKVLF
jgi:hypothetical protein